MPAVYAVRLIICVEVFLGHYTSRPSPHLSCPRPASLPTMAPPRWGSAVSARADTAAPGHPEVWTCDDLEFAPCEGKRDGPFLGRAMPRPTPFGRRPPITPDDGAALPIGPLSRTGRPPIGPHPTRLRRPRLRRALFRALVSEGFLLYRKRGRGHFLCTFSPKQWQILREQYTGTPRARWCSAGDAMIKGWPSPKFPPSSRGRFLEAGLIA